MHGMDNKKQEKKRTHCLSTADGQYRSFAACFHCVGKVGKPPKQPEVVFNNRLLLQLQTLKDEAEVTWLEVELFFSNFSRYRITSSGSPHQSCCSAIWTTEEGEPWEHFWQMTEMWISLGHFQTKPTSHKSALINNDITKASVSLSNGLVAELSNFVTKQGLKDCVVFAWLSRLSRNLFFSSGNSASSSCLKSCITRQKMKLHDSGNHRTSLVEPVP